MRRRAFSTTVAIGLLVAALAHAGTVSADVPCSLTANPLKGICLFGNVWWPGDVAPRGASFERIFQVYNARALRLPTARIDIYLPQQTLSDVHVDIVRPAVKASQTISQGHISIVVKQWPAATGNPQTAPTFGVSVSVNARVAANATGQICNKLTVTLRNGRSSTYTAVGAPVAGANALPDCVPVVARG